MSGCDHRIGAQLTVVLYVLNPLIICLSVLLRSEVRITRTVFYRMPDFLAAVAPSVRWLLLLILLLGRLLEVLIVVLLGLMTVILAAWRVFALLTAAPPNFSGKLAAMNPATPLEVLLFGVIFAAVLACFLLHVNLAFLRFELLNALFHLFSLGYHILLLLLELHFLIEVLIALFRLRFNIPVKLKQLLLERVHLQCLLLLQLHLLVEERLRVLAIVVTLRSRLLDIL